MEQLIEFANNNMILVSGTVLMGLAVLFFELRKQADAATAISTAQAVRLINQGARVLDIRDAAKFEAGHIIDSINMPTTELGAEDSVHLKKAKSIVLVCDTGGDSARHVAVLRKSGIENAFSLQGGISAWQKENLPVVTTESEKPAGQKNQKQKKLKHAKSDANE